MSKHKRPAAAQPEIAFTVSNTLADSRINPFARLYLANQARGVVGRVNEVRSRILADRAECVGQYVTVAHEARVWIEDEPIVNGNGGWNTQLVLLHNDGRPGQLALSIVAGTRPEHVRLMLDVLTSAYAEAFEQLEADARQLAVDVMSPPQLDDDLPF